MRIRLILVVLGLLLTMILPWGCLITLMFGLMVVERISLQLVALRLLVLAFICLALSLHLMIWFGERCSSGALPCFSACSCVMQTVQRAEFWCAIVALQAYWLCHLGSDNLNVARSIGCLLRCGRGVMGSRLSQ